MDLCDIRKKQPVKIHVEGEGDFCLDCYNKAFLEKICVEDTYDYPRQMSVIEPSGKMHSFNIEHVILGAIPNSGRMEKTMCNACLVVKELN